MPGNPIIGLPRLDETRPGAQQQIRTGEIGRPVGERELAIPARQREPAEHHPGPAGLLRRNALQRLGMAGHIRGIQASQLGMDGDVGQMRHGGCRHPERDKVADGTQCTGHVDGHWPTKIGMEIK